MPHCIAGKWWSTIKFRFILLEHCWQGPLNHPENSSVEASGISQSTEVQSTWSREKVHWLRTWSLMAFWGTSWTTDVVVTWWCLSLLWVGCRIFQRFAPCSQLPLALLHPLPRELVAIMMRIRMDKATKSQQIVHPEITAASVSSLARKNMNKGRLISSESSWFTLIYELHIPQNFSQRSAKYHQGINVFFFFFAGGVAQHTFLPFHATAAKDSVWSQAPGRCQITWW